MANFSRDEIIDLLQMPFDEFKQTIVPRAKAAYVEACGNVILPTAVLGFSNYCINTCLYCGMRAPNSNLKRFRMPPDEIIDTAMRASELGLSRILMISGEDMGYGFDSLLDAVRGVKELGFFITLAAGAFSAEQYGQLRDAGVDEYKIKFETADEAAFDRLHPSTNFKKRMCNIRVVQESGMRLASGSIIDYPGQTLTQLADDILFTKELGVSWAPNIPYRPHMGTPFADEGQAAGSLEMNLRHIAILRILMPGINITAQQPGRGKDSGVCDEGESLEALNAGGNILFFDLVPRLLKEEFGTAGFRDSAMLEHLRRLSDLSGMTLAF